MKLEKGVALVLVGPPGCGKSTLARALAKEVGTYCEIDGHELESPFQHWMDQWPKTVIVDGFPGRKDAMQKLKAMLTTPMMTVNRQHLPPVQKPTPHFIFCTHELPAGDLLSDYRVHVVHAHVQLHDEQKGPLL